LSRKRALKYARVRIRIKHVKSDAVRKIQSGKVDRLEVNFTECFHLETRKHMAIFDRRVREIWPLRQPPTVWFG